MIQGALNNLSVKYVGVEIDEFIVMPNHIHTIILLKTNVGAGPRACPGNEGTNIQPPKGQPHGVAPTMSLPDAACCDPGNEDDTRNHSSPKAMSS